MKGGGLTPERRTVRMGKGRYRVRRMRPTDVAAVEEIDRLSFRLPWPAGAFARELTNPQSVLWVAETEEGPGRTPQVVGMLVLWLVLDEAHIATVAVHPYHRGQGVGKLLVGQAVAFAREQGYRTVTLEVRVTNQRAQRLYAQFGFAVVGRRYGYYNDNHEDALIMTLDLSAAANPQGGGA